MNRAPLLAGLFAIYLLAPGYSTAIFHGIPLGVAGLVALTVVVFVLLFFWRTETAVRPAPWLAGLIVALTIVKMMLAVAAPRPGWLSQQYVNDRFEPPAQASTDFTIPGATRIDTRIDFADNYLPVYFLNEAHYNRGMRREVTFPLSLRWTGQIGPERATTRSVTLAVRGSATLLLDGTPIVRAGRGGEPASITKEVTFAPGLHVLTLDYVKPADTDPLIRLQGLEDTSGDMLVTPSSASAWERRLAQWTRRGAALLDAAIIVAGLAFAWMLLTAIWLKATSPTSPTSPTRPSLSWRAILKPRPLAAAMFVLLVSQGVYKAGEHINRAETLTGGDDWLAFEARAREVITGGLLMDFGAPRGQGEVFYYYPFYSYFIAAVHELAGEDLFGPIFIHFVLLFGTNVVAYRLGSRLYGPRAALGAVAALVVIEQFAFVRHYSVHLLSENLYFFTVAVTIDRLVRFVDDHRPADLVLAGLAGGVSSITRPAMMAYLPLAVAVVALASWKRTLDDARVRRATAAAAVLLACWFAVLSLTTLRNYIVAGSPVLICNTPSRALVIYNLPATPDAMDRYLGVHKGNLLSTSAIIFRIMVEEPRSFFTNVAIKVGFSFGILQLMGQRVHPELILASAGYLAAIVFLPSARALRTWPIHGFVIAHLAGMVAHMPSNYGYRLILPMYIFFPMFGAALVERRLARLGPVGVARLHPRNA